MFEDDDKDEYFFRWQIKNFSFANKQTGNAIHSPHFEVEMLDDTKWFLSIYPRGKLDDEFIDIFVTRCEEDGGEVQINIIFTIELEAADSSRRERRVSMESIFERNSSWGFEQYIRRKTLVEDMKSTFLPDDVLTIHCKLERVPPEVEIVKEYIVETYPKIVDTEVPWTIKKWSKIRDFRKVYVDLEFAGDHKASFRIFVCKSDDTKKNLVLKLKKLKAKLNNIHLNCYISLLDAEDSEATMRKTCHHFTDSSTISPHELFDLKESYLKNDTLSLRCILTMKTSKMLHKRSVKVHELPIVKDEEKDLKKYIEQEFMNDFENMFLSGNFSDVKLRSGNKEVACHKSILSARSQVLSDLVDRAEESAEDGDELVIDINDLDGDTLEQMIYFLYSDKIKNIKLASALKLFVAGHKYGIRYLKQKCSYYLSQAFTFENVYDILMAAHIYEDGDLKRQAIAYLAEYFSRICLTIEWENFRKTEKDLGAYVCREIRRIKQI